MYICRFIKKSPMSFDVRASGSRPIGAALNVELTVLPMIVRCARLQMTSLSQCFQALVQLLFFTEQEDRFFQCSVTDCISLIASAAEIALFPAEHIELDPTEWSVVQVSPMLGPYALHPQHTYFSPARSAKARKALARFAPGSRFGPA